MAKNENHIYKLWYLISIMRRETDKDHPITMTQIIRLLEKEEIPVDRKTIATDIVRIETKFGKLDSEKEYGFQIEKDDTKKPHKHWFVDNGFSMDDLRTIIECLITTRAVSEKHAKDILRKLGYHINKYQMREAEATLSVNTKSSIHANRILENCDLLWRYIHKPP